MLLGGGAEKSQILGATGRRHEGTMPANPMKFSLLYACALAALPLSALQSPAGTSGLAKANPAQTAAAASAYPPGVPRELFEIERVVDGDTIWIQYHGHQEKLRLMCVDTEEKLAVDTGSASKPGTVFGESCAKWAQDFFAALGSEQKKPSVGIYFPAGREQRDAYGRLLCHIILPDGRDFNVLLVEEGKSPYFNKYGNSLVAHEIFVAAQKRAIAKHKGIWDPTTNVPQDKTAPSVRRPYETLLPWWEARAQAIDSFRKREVAEPKLVADAENPASLKLAAERGGEVDVFGSIERMFDEKSGDWTLLMRGEDKQAQLRVRVTKDKRPAFDKLDLAHLNDENRQNYIWVHGKLTSGSRGFELEAQDPAQFRIAEPHDPKLDAPKKP